jgi:plasmid stabilization system protein ParE
MFEVVYTAEADADIRAAFRYALRRAPATARLWFDRLNACINGLAEMPERFPVVSDAARVGFETREMLFGNRRRAYRIRYRILQNLVVILSVVRASRNR